MDDPWQQIRRLLERPDRARRAEELWRLRHPEAPAAAISTLAFHMFVDGTDALVALLVEQEELLAGQREELGDGTIHHVLYHLYNFLLAERLLAPGRAELAEDLHDVLTELAAESPDLGAIRSQLRALCARLEGHDPPPALS
jgi:hypothetical protein